MIKEKDKNEIRKENKENKKCGRQKKQQPITKQTELEIKKNEIKKTNDRRN